MTTAAELRKLAEEVRLRPEDGSPELANRIELALAEHESDLSRASYQREGWRKIGETLIAAAFGFEMRGFGDVPPIELLEAISEQKTEASALEALRDALIGRVWRVAGHKGYGTCDYPMCANRGRGVALENRTITEAASLDLEAPAQRTALRVCVNGISTSLPGECGAWAEYVAARMRAGRVKIEP
jgi:hypothetical protein